MADLGEIVRDHERWRLHDAVNLQPSENVMSEAARSLLASDFVHRYTLTTRFAPALGDAKNAYRGTKYTDAMESLAEGYACELFGVSHASLKPLSGHLAGFLMLQSCTHRGDRILVISAEHGGYDGYMPGFLPDYLDLEVDFLPFDAKTWNIDPKAAADAVLEKKPKLVLVGASLILFPYNIRWLRGACDDVNAVLAYDGSHVLGLLAGGEFQRPFQEGVDILTASTHKSFPGPQGGMLLSGRADLFDRAMDTIMWRTQDNANWGRIAATAQVLLEMKSFGQAYAKQVVSNSQALGNQLEKWGFPVKFKGLGFSKSHQLLIDTDALRSEWSLTPWQFADRLEKNNLVVDATGRLGTNEVTRMGAREEQMQTVASLVVRAARGEDVRREVAELRSGLRIAYVLPS